jgi:hypothetical protein
MPKRRCTGYHDAVESNAPMTNSPSLGTEIDAKVAGSQHGDAANTRHHALSDESFPDVTFCTHVESSQPITSLTNDSFQQHVRDWMKLWRDLAHDPSSALVTHLSQVTRLPSSWVPRLPPACVNIADPFDHAHNITSSIRHQQYVLILLLYSCFSCRCQLASAHTVSLEGLYSLTCADKPLVIYLSMV